MENSSFVDAKSQAEAFYKSIPPNERESVYTFVFNHGRWFIQQVSDRDFDIYSSVLTPDQLFALLNPIVHQWITDLQGSAIVPSDQPSLTSVLVVMLVHWFIDQHGGSKPGGWKTPFSSGIGNEIQKRHEANAHKRRIADFYASLGIPSSESSSLSSRPNPTQGLEDRKDLDASAKVNILKNAIDELNHRGITTPDGVHRINFIKYHRRSLEAARRYFVTNPELTPEQILVVFQVFSEIVQWTTFPELGEEDPDTEIRKCNDLGYLLVMLPRIARLRPECELEISRVLNRRQLFGEHFNPDQPEGSDHPDRPPLRVG